jgi:hypothetical protein
MKKIISSLLILLLFLFYSSCNKKDDNPAGPGNGGSDKIQTGDVVEIKTQTVGTAGGTITVDKPGDVLDGFELTVPPNGFTQTKSFTISYASITKHDLGQYFNPISPLIKISYEGGYSDQPMKVKVPIKLPQGHFAMGFFYDEETGQLEGLSIEALDSTSITVSTRHFAQTSSLAKRSGIHDAVSWGNLVISSIDEQQLHGQSIISSGFTPGVDDWEFINYGSYIAPGGHCAGQSLTAMWYYYEKKLRGESSLFHTFDEVNDKSKPGLLWQDNPRGYRFASSVQEDFDWTFWIKKVVVQTWFPELTWKAFALAMLVTGDPQLVIIRQSTPDYAAHAMIVYKINFTEGKLYIADPNFPNNRHANTGVESIRTIDFVNGQFTPYPSSLNAGSSPILFDQIAYFGKTANIEWSPISNRWTEFQNGTIGNDRFPRYTLWVEDGSGYELKDGLNTDADTLIFHCKSTDCAQQITGTDHYQGVDVYNDKGALISKKGSLGKRIIVLAPGQNKLGVYVKGAINNSLENYVDFKWINVTKESNAITIPPTKITNYYSSPGEMEPTYDLSGTIKGTGLTLKGSFPSSTQIEMDMSLLENALPASMKFEVKIQNISMRFIYGDANVVPFDGTYWNTRSRALGEYTESYKVRIKGYDWKYTKVDADGMPVSTVRTTDPTFTLTIDKINYNDPSTVSHLDHLEMSLVWEVTVILEYLDGRPGSTTTSEEPMDVLLATILKL